MGTDETQIKTFVKNCVSSACLNPPRPRMLHNSLAPGVPKKNRNGGSPQDLGG
jgi:hypothetical protein